MGVVVALGLVFLLAGGFVVEQSIFGRVRQGDRLGMAGMGSLFAGVGALIILLGVWNFRLSRREKEAQAAHPNEPWLWNRAWADGVIDDASNTALIGSWVLTVIINTIAWPAGVAGLQQAKHDSRAYLLLLFPAVGLALLATAMHFTLRRMKFGRSMLVLETMPGCIGGWFAATIETRRPIAAEALRLELRNIQRVTSGSGKSKHTHETVLWEDQQVLAGRLPSSSRGGSSVPVAFEIPARCKSTGKPKDDTEIVWRLRAHAAMEGTDYLAEFVVPVFDARSTQPAEFIPPAEHTAAKLRADTPSESRRGDDSSIGFLTGTGNRKRFVFPAGRNPGAAITLTIFAIVFAAMGIGVLVAMRDTFPRFLFGGLFSLISVPCLYGAAVMLLRRTELHFDPHFIERHRRMLGFSSVRSIKAAEVSKITYESNSTVNNTAYYGVFAKLNDGKSVRLASGLLVRDAKWVADEIASSLHVEASAESRGG
jgi:hypothetical protein